MLDLFAGEHPSNVNNVVMQSSLKCITTSTETLTMFTEYLGERCIKNCSHYWFLDTHFAVPLWVKIDDVVTAMVVPAVH